VEELSIDLGDIEDDLESRYIRSASDSFEFRARADGGCVEGVLRYHPFLYDRETYPLNECRDGMLRVSGCGQVAGSLVLSFLNKTSEQSAHVSNKGSSHYNRYDSTHIFDINGAFTSIRLAQERKSASCLMSL